MLETPSKLFSAARRGFWRAFGAASLTLLGVLTVPDASAQTALKPSGTITPTRLVWLFQGKERALLEAQAGGRTEVLESLLAEDFMQRSAVQPDIFLGRSEWQAATRAGLPKAATISQMMVHEHGPLAIASFVLAGPRGDGSFIVDVWRQREGADNYELLTRYTSPAPLKAKPRVTVPRPQNSGAPAR